MYQNENILKLYYQGVTQRVQIEIDYLNKLIGHRGETGTVNENLLINLLLKFLPKRYSIGSGIIIDKDGNRSKQIDIIVYDSHFHPELFSQGVVASLYPVDVIYMVIEVKTTVNRDMMHYVIENIASVKRLNFIESPVFIMEGDSYTKNKTSCPIGVIFGFNCDTNNFDTYDSWIMSKNIAGKEMFDLSYILHSTFFHAFLDIDRKDKTTKGIYLHEEYENVSDYEKYQGDRQHPLVGKHS